ncbi:hypothetical protein ACWDRB_48905 [Nonomuraea sp. NPDC003707]
MGQRLAAIAMSVLAGGILLTAVPSAAQAVPPCKQPVGAKWSAGRIVYLWWCDGTSGTRRGYHGQIQNVVDGDQVYLRSGTGSITALVNITWTGGNEDTPTVGDWGAPWAACITVRNVGETCTAHGKV